MARCPPFHEKNCSAWPVLEPVVAHVHDYQIHARPINAAKSDAEPVLPAVQARRRVAQRDR